MGLAERYENLFRSLYFDTAGTGAWRPAPEAAFNIASPDRIMFGTDYPLECKAEANMVEALKIIIASCLLTVGIGTIFYEVLRYRREGKKALGRDLFEALFRYLAAPSVRHRFDINFPLLAPILTQTSVRLSK